jgi:hypothetical protein
MRRFAGWFLAGCVALGFLPGCGEKVPTTKEKPAEVPKTFSLSGATNKK